MARVLVVEDEAVLRASMARALAKLPADVVEAGTLAEAVAHLEAAIPDVIVSDLDLPDGTGIERIGELGRRRVRVPVVFVSGYLRAYRAQIPPHADVEVREKPVALDELRALVRDRIGGVDGAVPPFAVADYLQLACLGKHSVVIEVGTRDAQRGRIEVVRGEVWHASDARGDGLPAFKRLTFGASHEVTCRTLVATPPVRSIEGKWEALLLDCAREHDEAVWAGTDDDEFEFSLSGEAPPAPATLAPEPPPSAVDPDDDEFSVTRDRAVEALLAHDYTTAAHLFAIAHALCPDDRSVAANVARLAAMGHGAPPAQEVHDA